MRERRAMPIAGGVVADEYYIRGLRCRRKVLDADRDSDVGCRQRWRVVHAVADHQHCPVDALLFDDCDFVCWSLAAISSKPNDSTPYGALVV